ncbi:unnamed protein product [Psylliodes chrysocephalus]|uniref:N-acetyltransferase domain-containing protein n=1 Tax=Psylliodes chrysocephalus TaxID=3402493 RepID=A0A9P0GGN0_9CUCU|nr:unnamed protein product [Psylliodes chrysocephala]
MSEEFNAIIRKAEKDDMVHVFEMIKELAAFEKLEDQVKIDYSVLEQDGFNGNRPFFGCIVAELPDHSLIGYALYYYCYSTWEGKAIFLEDLYVKPNYRRHGIGAKMFLAVMKTAHDAEIKRVDFHVLSWNPAIAFYKKMGAINLSETEDWTLFRMNHGSLQKLFS